MNENAAKQKGRKCNDETMQQQADPDACSSGTACLQIRMLAVPEQQQQQQQQQKSRA